MNTGGYFCPRCTKRVYFAEEVIAMGKHWHKSCFLCAHCGKRLDSRTCTDREGEAYCNICYKRLFGPKGYGYGSGAGTLSMDSGDPNGKVTSNISSYCKAQVPSSINGSSGSPSPRNSMSPISPTGKFTFSSPADVCRRCGKNVYLAERMVGGGSAWHKITCFTCYNCNRRLESTTLCEKENEIYCKSTYVSEICKQDSNVKRHLVTCWTKQVTRCIWPNFSVTN